MTELFGTATLTNCTVSDNSVGNYGVGGGVTDFEGTITLNNCTVSGNSARRPVQRRAARPR